MRTEHLSNAFSRLAITVLLVSAATSAHAATLNWPGPAPCNGTLQACVNAAANGDTIELVGSSPITQIVNITNKSLTLRGRSNTGSTFQGFVQLEISTTGSASPTVVVEGLVFTNGGIVVTHQSSAPATVQIRRVRASRNWNFPPLVLSAIGAGQLNAVVENNDLDVAPNAFGFGGISAVAFGPADFRIAFNRIRITNSEGTAIEVAGNTDDVRARIYGNRITGQNYNAGILASDGGSTGQLTVDIVSNVVHGQNGNVGSPGAIVVDSSDGRVNAWVVHNTVVDNRNGIIVSGRPDLGAIIGGLVRNNLIAWNSGLGLSIQADLAGVTNRNNLVHGNGSNAFTPGTGTVTTAPRLRPDRYRPYDGSPAINAALDMTTQLANEGNPSVDADGQPRKNGVNPDIGAFETQGNFHFLHRASSTNTTGHVSQINWPFINTRPSARTLFTPNWNPGGVGGTYNDRHTGIYYEGATSSWAIFNQNFAAMPVNASFNLAEPHPDHTFVHTVSASNQAGFTTIVSNPNTNSRPDRFLLAVPYWTGTYYDAGIALGYLPPNWLIVNPSNNPVPVGANFFIHQQDRSHAAFSVVTRAPDIFSNWVDLDHPLLNDKPCAQIQVTQGFGSIRVAAPIGVFYDAFVGRHAIFRQDLGAMPVGAEFNVWFDPWQVEQCTSGELFRDGFEPS
jgi:hypothetical protein